MKVERKAVKRNLMNLIEFGYNINYIRYDHSEHYKCHKDRYQNGKNC